MLTYKDDGKEWLTQTVKEVTCEYYEGYKKSIRDMDVEALPLEEGSSKAISEMYVEELTLEQGVNTQAIKVDDIQGRKFSIEADSDK